MKEKIWRFLAQILYYRNEAVDIIKPFYENLNNNNINNHNNIQILKTFSHNLLKFLYEKDIITKENFTSLISKNQQNTQTQIRTQSENDNKINKGN